MGQNQVTQLQECIPVIYSLDYKEFLLLLSEINKMLKDYPDSNGKKIIFAIKKGSDESIFWKATIQIAATKVNLSNNRIDTVRFLNLLEFLNVYKTIKYQISVEKDCKASNINFSQLLSELPSSNIENLKECCICLERTHEITLPCTHSFCTKCIEDWNVSHDTCPICREKIESTDDSWVLSEIPQSEEITNDIKQNLNDLMKVSHLK